MEQEKESPARIIYVTTYDPVGVIHFEDMPCVLCAGEKLLLKLLPCSHKALCQPCFDAVREEGPVNCPVCMQQVIGTATEWQEQQQAILQGQQIDYELSELRRHRSLTGVRISKCLGLGFHGHAQLGFFGIGEEDIYSTVGVGCRIVFHHARVISLFLFFVLFLSAPMILSYATGQRHLASNFGDSRQPLDAFKDFVLDYSLNTCLDDKCRWIDVAVLMELVIVAAGFYAVTRLGKPTNNGFDLKISKRTLLVVRAPHRIYPLTKEGLKTYFVSSQIQQQNRREAKMSKKTRIQKRGNTYIVEHPPIITPKIVEIVNYSSEIMEFIDNVKERKRLRNKLESKRLLLKATFTWTKKHHAAQRCIAAVEKTLERMDRNYFNRMFLREKIGPWSRKNSIMDSASITFENELQASFVKKLFNRDDSWDLWYSFKSIFGIPTCEFRCIGDFDEIYPANLNWGSLKTPRSYSQGPWYAQAAGILAMVLIGWHVGAFLIWSWVMNSEMWIASALIQILLERSCMFVIKYLFSLYAHPLYTFTFHNVSLTNLLCVSVPVRVVWPCLWIYGQTKQAFGIDSCISAFILHVQQVQVFYLIATVTYGHLLRDKIVSALKPMSLTQEEQDRNRQPCEWDLVLAASTVHNIALDAFLFSSLVPAIVPIGCFHLAILYISEKHLLLGYCSFPYRLSISKTAVAISRVLEFALLPRFLITAYVFNIVRGHDGMFFLTEISESPDILLLPICILCSAAFLSLWYAINRFASIRTLVFKLCFCNGYFCRNYYKRKLRESSRKWWSALQGDSKVEPMEVAYDPKAAFDYVNLNYYDLIHKVNSIEDLERWKVPESNSFVSSDSFESEQESISVQ